ncbi:ATP/maltotriose-dependent transcriptional regulator MalT/DNA-binding SARP family transcriptional activator [Desulfosalsimonas propionicica]|uniref:ATP/maltotriose-dependent transcriptional regulator MalT/DNA-binding SARP family transcriptional activator n=1 Tax=Desulfosalsimonas propionicica TaxID=332175 RepID=A0A7W0HM50_9BACT|nr:ATP/maltotriose-dependent transcriptional regulator MalT/DNA-binding SARP family transcriptional activator [Desulfosalsimonas propionicica]
MAKITKPRLQKVLPRKRLFDLLDDTRAYAATWICGPGGSGKTTFIASYIEENQLPCLWYQIDEGDSDIAAFFYYLGVAGKALGREEKDLPFLTPEYALGISSFTRRFFEQLFEQLGRPGVIVLDNYQDAPPESQLHEVVRNALSMIPEDINLFILSRTEPHSILARAAASNFLAEIGWPALRLQPQETRDLVRLLSRTPPSEVVIDSLHKKVDGWLAGLLLLLKRAETEDIDPGTFTQFTGSEVFDYFTSEIFDKADKETQEFLLSTSVLPTFSATMAQNLTGTDNAEEILSRIRQNHWFTERFPGRETRYQYHPLFREYLQSQAAQTFTGKHMKRLKQAAARLLEAEGQTEAAIELFLESGHPHEVVRLILSQAEMLVIQGRNQTLEQWLRRLPEEVFSKYPYALYWLGVCRHRFDPDEGRELFEKAFSLFAEQKDTEGIWLSLCGILYSITVAWDSFKPLDQWIQKLTQFSRQYEALASLDVRGRLSAVAIFSLTFRSPDHPEFKTWEKRGQAILQENISAEIKLRVIVALAWHRLFSGNLAEAEHFIELYQEMVQSPNIPPFSLLALMNAEAFYYFLNNNFEACSNIVTKSLDLASATGIHLISPIVLGHGAAGALAAEDLDSAHKHLRNMAQYAHSSDWIFIYFKILKIWQALLEKNFSKALIEGESAEAYVAESGMPMTDSMWYQGMAIALHASGKTVEASRYLQQALSISSRVGFHQIEFGCHLTQAQFALDAGDETAARNSLQKAMAIGKAQQYVNTWLWRSDTMARLCCKALEENIEVAYVQDLILRRNLIPQSPPLEIENWPWPIRIYTLGRFSLIKDGSPLSFTKKAQEKPLAMLKTIIALGGRSVSENQVADLLWPDSDGDAAHGAFKTNLHRLRKLVGYHEAIEHRHGNIKLDTRYCWVDAWIFERMISRATSAWGSAAGETELLNAAALTQKALDLYKGPLFQSEDHLSTHLREHLHHLFIQGVQQLGEYRQKRKQWEEAISLYERGLKIDGLVEPFYRGLMVSRYQLGQKAKAMAAYERCKKSLAENLNTSPSTTTDSLKHSLFPADMHK